MTRRLAPVIVLFAAMPASADVTAPIWMKYDTVTVILELDEPMPEFDFYRCDFHRSYMNGKRHDGTSYEALAVKAGEPTRVTRGRRAGPFAIVAVRRPGNPPGPKAGTLEFGDVVPWDADLQDRQPEIVLRYRVERAPGGEGVVFTRAEGTRPAADGGRAVYQGEFAVRWAVAGVAATLAVCGFGLWLVRRWSRPATASVSQRPADGSGV